MNFNLIVSAVWLAGIFFANAAPAQTSPRARISIDDHWRFTKGNLTNVSAKGLRRDDLV